MGAAWGLAAWLFAAPPGPEPGAEPAASTPSATDESRPASRAFAPLRGGWLSLQPAGRAVPGPRPRDLAALRTVTKAGYRWGVSAGISFAPRDHLFISAAASLAQTLWMARNIDGYELCFRGDCYGYTERGIVQLLQLGAQLRIGYAGRWLMAWGLLGVHLGVSRVRLDCDHGRESCGRSETDVGPMLGGGVGAAVRVTSRFAIGLESGIDHAWVDGRDDPFARVRTINVSLVTVLRF